MKPWHQVVTPRKDLRDGKPLDASEFAIHLHQVVSGTAPADYREPRRFFERTYLTQGLSEIAVEVLRRLGGQTVNAAPVINLTTPFGGGKTHALSLLYHLATVGTSGSALPGVDELLRAAELQAVPRAAVATFVGTDFDPIVGRSGPGEPTRFTPWGDVAWQLGGQSSFDLVREQDRLRVRPGGDVLRRLLPADRPVLILMDEVLNFLNAARAVKAGDAEGRNTNLASQFLAFLQTLTEEAAARTGLVLVMALPKSEQEMSAEDSADFARLQKLSSRVDRPFILAQGLESAEIIRRRLFEHLGPDSERRAVIRAYVKELARDRELLPSWFPQSQASDLFAASYPFHPAVLSVFERKWQALPAFQRTRGVLRMLALWVSQSYLSAYRDARREPLITLGMAPLGDPHFRAAVLEQLGDTRLEVPVLTDIAGPGAHAVALDRVAPAGSQVGRLHQAVATAVLFESCGGQVRADASLPEVRLALDSPDFELGHVETALAALVDTCYYLTAEGARYHLSLRPNLNKLLADVRAGLDMSRIEERAREEVQAVFRSGAVLERRLFPERSADLPNAAILTLVVLPPLQGLGDAEAPQTLELIRTLLDDAGSSARTYKSALFFAVPSSASRLHEGARKLLAWESLHSQSDSLRLDEGQLREVAAQRERARRDLSEAVWQTYHTVAYLGPDGEIAQLDLGLLHSSAGETLPGYIETRLRQQDILVDSVSPDFLVRHWPPALQQWPLRALRDSFFASPKLPRLSDSGALRATLARGISDGAFGLAHLDSGGRIASLTFHSPISEADVEFGDDLVLVSQTEAAARETDTRAAELSTPVTEPDLSPDPGISHHIPQPLGTDSREHSGVKAVTWSGELPPQKWMLFYNRVLTKLVRPGGLRVHLDIVAEPDGGLTSGQADEVAQGLADLELPPAQILGLGSVPESEPS